MPTPANLLHRRSNLGRTSSMGGRVVLLFAITTGVLFSYPTNADNNAVAPTETCEDDPTFEFDYKRNKNVDCEWISGKGKKQKRKICKKKRKKNGQRKKIRFFCPLACGECEKNKCPTSVPETGDDCPKVGLECSYDYKYGFDYNQYVCNPSKKASCQETLKWFMSEISYESSPYIGLCQNPERSCEPCQSLPDNPKCPTKEPKRGKSCDIPKKIDCHYGSEITGCSVDELQCQSLTFFNCINGKWQQGVRVPSECPKPKQNCPESLPIANGGCEGYPVGLSCSYNYHDVSCNADEPDCSPLDFFTCENDGWLHSTIDLLPCASGKICDEQTKEVCPESPPVVEECVGEYPVGLECLYIYVDASCDDTEEQCIASETYMCGKEFGWEIAVIDLPPCASGKPCIPTTALC